MKKYKITYYKNGGNTIVKSLTCTCKNDLEAFRFARANKPSDFGKDFDFFDIEMI